MIYFETWYNKGNESIKSYWKGGIIVNALHRHEEERVEEVLAKFACQGYSITDTRRAVLSYLVASHEHPSAEKIYRDLLPQFPSMSLATVYNNIKVLIDEGLSLIKVRNDTTNYFDFMGHDHLNVVCEKMWSYRRCGHRSPRSLRRSSQSKWLYQITKTQMTVYGICPGLSEKLMWEKAEPSAFFCMEKPH